MLQSLVREGNENIGFTFSDAEMHISNALHVANTYSNTHQSTYLGYEVYISEAEMHYANPWILFQ